MRQLGMLDALFVLMEKSESTTQHIGMMFVFDPSTADEPVTFDRILELYRQRIPLVRAFREKLVRVPLDLDYPFWINDGAFDLGLHVRHAAVPRPGTRAQFFELLDAVISQPLDLARPLWETWFIEGLDAIDGIPPGSFALVAKMHHAAVDGISGMEMITAVLEDDATATARMPSDEWRPEEEPDQRTLLMNALGANLSSARKLVDALRKVVPSFQENRRRTKSGELIKPPKINAPKTRFNDAVTLHRVHEGRSFAFAEIKRLKDAVPGATINDLVMAVAAGALRRYLLAKGELPEDPLVFSVPFSVRRASHAGTGGNRVIIGFPNAHTDIGDPLERMLAIGKSMRAIKDYNKTVNARALAAITKARPGALLGLATRATALVPPSDRKRVSNGVVTNIPGPQTPLTLLGARYVAGFGSGPSQDGIGLYTVITSLSGVLSIGMSSYREMVPDPEFYGQCIEESFAELKAAIESQNQPAKVMVAAPPRRTAARGPASKPSIAAAKPVKAAAAKPTKTSPAAKPTKAQPAKARAPKPSSRSSSR